MSDTIKPSEISEVLLAQLKEIDTDPRFEEVGQVLQVSDGVVRIQGLLKAEAGELLEFDEAQIILSADPPVPAKGKGKSIFFKARLCKSSTMTPVLPTP